MSLLLARRMATVASTRCILLPATVSHSASPALITPSAPPSASLSNAAEALAHVGGEREVAEDAADQPTRALASELDERVQPVKPHDGAPATGEGGGRSRGAGARQCGGGPSTSIQTACLREEYQSSRA